MFTYSGLKSCRWTKHTWPQKEKILIGAQPSKRNFPFYKKLSPGFNPLALDVATQQNILNYETFFFSFWSKTCK